MQELALTTWGFNLLQLWCLNWLKKPPTSASCLIMSVVSWVKALIPLENNLGKGAFVFQLSSLVQVWFVATQSEQSSTGEELGEKGSRSQECPQGNPSRHLSITCSVSPAVNRKISVSMRAGSLQNWISGSVFWTNIFINKWSLEEIIIDGEFAEARRYF